MAATGFGEALENFSSRRHLSLDTKVKKLLVRQFIR
jgi:hypothetical protein